MLPVPFGPTRIFVTSSRLYTREISRSFTSLNEHSSAAPKKPRATPPPRTQNAKQSAIEATKHLQTVRLPSKQRRPLEPYELSRRLIELCEQGNADLAVDMLQRAPKNAQNVKVWNTLIQQCMDAEKYKLAFHVFTDVRPPTYHALEQLMYCGPDEASRFHAKHQDICDLDEWVCRSR